jgi:DNA end-binding protein Ku
MARPYWTGQIQISLVSFTVKLFVATESKGEIRFHQISRKTGERVRHQKVLASAMEDSTEEASSTADKAVDKSDIVKGYEYRKGEYVLIEPEEIANLRVPSKHTVEITQFVPLDELAPEYLEKPYFVVPENDLQTEAFTVVRGALEKTKKAALGKIAFGGREHILAITAAPGESGMMAYTMRYQEELRQPAEYFRDIKKVAINEDSLELAESLIKKRSGKFDPSKFVDGYEIALKELVEAKVNKAPVPQDEAPAVKRGNVVNLMDALRKSLADKEASKDSSKESSIRKPAASAKKEPKPASATPAVNEGISLVKPSTAKAAKRRSA